MPSLVHPQSSKASFLLLIYLITSIAQRCRQSPQPETLVGSSSGSHPPRRRHLSSQALLILPVCLTMSFAVSRPAKPSPSPPSNTSSEAPADMRAARRHHAAATRATPYGIHQAPRGAQIQTRERAAAGAPRAASPPSPASPTPSSSPTSGGRQDEAPDFVEPDPAAIEGWGEAEKRRQAVAWMTAKSWNLPNGEPVRPPPWYRRDWRNTSRPVAWKKDWVTGIIRPRRMMDDMLDGELDRRRKASESGLSSTVRVWARAG